MTPQLPQKTQQKKNEWLSPLVLSILAAVSLNQIGDTTSLAAAAECQFTEDSGTIQGMPIWMGTTSRILPCTFTGKAQAKAHTQGMKVLALPYNGMRQVFTIRRTPPEIGIYARYKALTIIGPVQQIQKSNLSDEQKVSQSVATLPATVEFPSLFVAVNPFQSAVQLSDNESLRMNRTTTQVLHEGNYASGCP